MREEERVKAEPVPAQSMVAPFMSRVQEFEPVVGVTPPFELTLQPV